MDKDFLKGFPEDFKFSEERLTLQDDFIEQKDPPSNFDITFKSDKKCNIDDNNPAINDTKICRNCYYRRFAEKLSSVRKSKRKDFVNFQMSIRENKGGFLTELDEFLTDNDEYFNNKDYSITSDYKGYISELLFEMENDNLNSVDDINQYIESETLDIFISHSSNDEDIAQNLVDILTTSLRLDHNKIRCTSVDGYKLEGGANTNERLKIEIFSSKVLIGIITKHSLSSHYVLFELGARWGSRKPFRPVVIDKSDYGLLQEPLKNINVLNLSNPAEIHQLINEISGILKLNIESAAIYQKKIQILIDSIKKRFN